MRLACYCQGLPPSGRHQRSSSPTQTTALEVSLLSAVVFAAVQRSSRQQLAVTSLLRWQYCSVTLMTTLEPATVCRCFCCTAEIIKAAADSDEPAALAVLQPGTALLLLCVRESERAADLVVESQSVR
jgi:hypothetical protein